MPMPDNADEAFLDRWDAQDDDGRPNCPTCGEPMTHDWEGDPDVIGGTRDFYICEECPEQTEETDDVDPKRDS
jgi:hypothetical protein